LKMGYVDEVEENCKVAKSGLRRLGSRVNRDCLDAQRIEQLTSMGPFATLLANQSRDIGASLSCGSA
jgi:hypothetical protein